MIMMMIKRCLTGLSQNYFRNTIRVSISNILGVFIWVQIVCNCYQQTTKVAAGKERVKRYKNLFIKVSQVRDF